MIPRQIWIILFIIFFKNISAQERPEWKFGLSGQLLGPTVLGVYTEFNLIPKTNLTIGFGTNANFQIGITYDLVAQHKRIYWYPFIGAQLVFLKVRRGDAFSPESRANGIYFPLGLKFITMDNWVFAFEMAYNYVKTEADQVNTKPWVAAIRAGKYF